jgi:hypothetical protein
MSRVTAKILSFEKMNYCTLRQYLLCRLLTDLLLKFILDRKKEHVLKRLTYLIIITIVNQSSHCD